MVGSAFRTQMIKYESHHEFFFTSSRDYDLRERPATFALVDQVRPDCIIHLAARVGGVKGNMDYVADFYSQNIQMNTNLLDAAYSHGVKKVVSFLSTCIYPDNAQYPLVESQIHHGAPHSSNFGYAYAKRMLDVQSRAYREQFGCDFITVVPNNLYGPGDNFHLSDGHALPVILRKIYEAKKRGKKEVILWGDGSPLREFTYSQDLPDIILFLIEKYSETHPINIGNTEEISIKDLAQEISYQLGYEGEIRWDTTMPTGQHRKPSSNQKLIDMGWKKNHYTPVREGLKKTCQWFIMKYPEIRGI